MYKMICQRFFILFLLITCSPMVHAVLYPELPTDGQFVVDQTDTLSKSDIDSLNLISRKLWQEKQIPIVTVLITSLGSMEAGNQSIERYTREVFDHWQLGHEDRNYGVILLVSLGDRKARIEMGMGWDHRYDREARVIMDNYIIPQFQKRNFALGIYDGVLALDKVVRGLKLPEPQVPWWTMPAMVIGGLLLLGVIISLFKNGRSGWGWALIAGIGFLLWIILRNSGGGGGGLSGGGSGGGGGATGSW